MYPVVDLIATLAQQITDHVLARPFGAAGPGIATKSFVVESHRVKTGIDGVGDFLGVVAGVHHGLVPLIRWFTKARIKTYFGRNGIRDDRFQESQARPYRYRNK